MPDGEYAWLLPIPRSGPKLSDLQAFQHDAFYGEGAACAGKGGQPARNPHARVLGHGGDWASELLAARVSLVAIPCSRTPRQPALLLVLGVGGATIGHGVERIFTRRVNKFEDHTGPYVGC